MTDALPSDRPPYDVMRLRHVAGEIITNVRELSAAGWTPATSSNFSHRLDDTLRSPFPAATRAS